MTWIRILVNKLRESPAIFKNQGKYFLIASGCSSWSPNAASYAVADHIMGPWTERENPCKGDNAEVSFFSQGGFVLPVANKSQGHLFLWVTYGIKPTWRNQLIYGFRFM